jgi:hypothetical protein
MANTGMTYNDVKSVEDMLECSPSAHQPSSSIYSANAEPQAQKKASKSAAPADSSGADKPMGQARKKASKAPGAWS